MFIFPVVLLARCSNCGASRNLYGRFFFLEILLYQYYSKSGAGNYTCSKLYNKSSVFSLFLENFYQIFNDAGFFLEKSEFLPDLNKFAIDGSRSGKTFFGHFVSVSKKMKGITA